MSAVGVSKAVTAEDTKDKDVPEDEAEAVAAEAREAATVAANEKLQWAIDEIEHNRADIDTFHVGELVSGMVIEELEDGVGLNIEGCYAYMGVPPDLMDSIHPGDLVSDIVVLRLDYDQNQLISECHSFGPPAKDLEKTVAVDSTVPAAENVWNLLDSHCG